MVDELETVGLDDQSLPALVGVVDALAFAAHWHAGQRRKGARGQPYVNHLIEVTALLVDATGGSDPILAMAGALHDVVEDCEVTIAEVEARFGPEVASVVLEVTDDMSLRKAERKRLQIETMAAKSPRARLLKLADKTSNLRDILAGPPPHWSAKRRRNYVEWAAAVADAGCRGMNARLEAAFDATLREARQAFAKPGSA